MNLILHSPSEKNQLFDNYKRALGEAVEIYIVSAYLTAWDSTFKINSYCKRFQIIVGKDFGITRKKACIDLLKSLPSERKYKALVANIDGFHPKSVFWKRSDGKCLAIIGSSNLTSAAFETNYEANIVLKISGEQFKVARTWVDTIARDCIPMSEDWLENHYHEAPRKQTPNRRNKTFSKKSSDVGFSLPIPEGIRKIIKDRETKLRNFNTHRKELVKLFQKCAANIISSEKFYSDLQEHWSVEMGDRLTGSGFAISGKYSDFGELSRSIITIINADSDARDDVVVQEIDRLAKCSPPVPTRGAFLSEMLCLMFPESFPILNKPVKAFIRSICYKPPHGATQGAKYLHFALTLRSALSHNPNHPAKNLAELDAVLWRWHNEKG